MNLDKKEFNDFIERCHETHDENTQFLIAHGWKQDGEFWISPKGTKCRNHLGFFCDEFDVKSGLAIDIAKHEIVLEQFSQFKVELYDEDDDEPHDFFFPCIKDGKLYSYLDAVNIAVYNDYSHIEYEKYDLLIDYLSQSNVEGPVVKINEFIWFNDNGDLEYRFEHRD